MVEISDNLKKDLKYLGITLAIGLAIIGLHNLYLPDDYPEVGFTEVEVNCAGFEAGETCVGVKHVVHETQNFDDWESIEEGTDNHRKMIESELMIRASDACSDAEITEMDWTSEVEFENQTADEWQEEIDELTLLPCEETFQFSLEDEHPNL